MNKKDLFLESPSGYFYPFVPSKDEDSAVVTLDYGEQIHPERSEKFFHHGVDYLCPRLPLYAVASGVVVGVGDDSSHGAFITVRYGKYYVRYAHISEAKAVYGQKVNAAEEIAVSGDFLHIDVHYNDEEMNPTEFIAMLNSNIAQLIALGQPTIPETLVPDVSVKTDYDEHQEEIQELMLEWMPQYMNDIRHGVWQSSEYTYKLLHSTFVQAAKRNYFYEETPTLANPLGISKRGDLLASKFQNILIKNFLSYLALRHQIYIPSWTEEQKKNFEISLSLTGK